VIFVANPITRKINTVSASRGTNGVYRFEQLPDLVSTDDDFFRPVAIRFGPDGCLYIVDWYNRIISHNEIDRNHPARDKTRGRVWRVRHESQTRRTAPNVAAAPNRALLKHLQSPSTWEMRAAWHQIVQRNARELIPALAALARDARQADDLRIHALWCLEGLGHYQGALYRDLLASRSEDLRHEAVRALSTVRPPLKDAFALLQELNDEPTFRVRWEVLRFFRDHPEPLAAEHLAWLRRWRTTPNLKDTVKGWERDYLAPGGTYESAFQNLLLQMVEEKGRGKIAVPSSSRWTQVVARHPGKDPAEKRQVNARIARLTQRVDAAPKADLARGQTLFQATCAACHSTRNDGTGFGPPLAGSKNRTTEAVLTSVLDPSQAIEGVFRTYHVETTDGETYEGFFGDETADALTVRFAGGTRQVIPIKSIKVAGYVDGQSVMPEGLLDALTDDQVVDLVRYVQSLK
jgi:putative heme-binding domain-containing protein